MSVSLKTEVKELLRKVPVPPGYQFPAGASEEDLRAAENRLGFPLPLTLRDWLKGCNGSLVGPGGLLGWIERKLVPVAGDGYGNYYVMAVSQGPAADPIVFVDTVRDPL